jgi:hypothetical protein
VARRKRTKRPPVPSSTEILEQLRINFYALIGLQAANAKGSEEKFSEISRKSRENLKTELEREFGGPRRDQIERLPKRERARREKTRKNAEK